jgi:hypothetical protein
MMGITKQPMARLLPIAASFLLGVSTSVAQETTLAASDPSAIALRHDFAVFDPQYPSDFQPRAIRLSALKNKVVAQEVSGVKNECARQILFEAGTLLMTSADFKRIDRRTDELEVAIAHPSQDKQDDNGLWGSCSEQWFLKLDNTFDRLTYQAHDQPDPPPGPLPAFLDRVATPEKLKAYLGSVSVSDVQHTGADHDLEFNLAVSDLLRMIVLGEPLNYKVDPALHDAFLNLLKHRYQDKKTGFWGESYRRDGRVEFQPDISTTFHIVSYLHGDVPEMPRLIDTVLAGKDYNAPRGWLSMGQFWNHNNMDVVTEFRYGWASASGAQRKAMATEIQRMIDWCLKDSLQPDGSFKLTTGDPSIEYAEYFGTEFLAEAGFFSPSLRFWTDRSFPESAEIKQRIAHFIADKPSGTASENYRGVAKELNRH